MTKKTEKFIEKVEKKYPGRYQILSEYQASRIKISVKCLICKDVREVTPDNLLQHGGCSICGKLKRIKTRTASKEEFVEELKEKRGTDYTLIGEYKNKRTKTLFRHKCGGIHELLPQSIISNKTKGCPTCMGGVAMPETLIKKRFEEKAKGEYVLHGKYEGIDKKMDVEHLTCGTVWEVSMENFLNRGTRCPKCANKKTETTFLKEFKKYSKGEWDLLSKYKGIQEYVFVKHKETFARIFESCFWFSLTHVSPQSKAIVFNVATNIVEELNLDRIYPYNTFVQNLKKRRYSKIDQNHVSLHEKFFSIRKIDGYKVVYLCGLKLRFKNRLQRKIDGLRLEMMRHYEEHREKTRDDLDKIRREVKDLEEQYKAHKGK